MTHTVSIPASGLKVGHQLGAGKVTKIRVNGTGRIYVLVSGEGVTAALAPMAPGQRVTVIKGRAS